MSEVPFRNRPVLEHIVEQHAEEAAFLWLLRDAATEAPHYKRHHLARLDERVEAHIDGLRVAGEAGWRIAMAELKAHPEPGELFAAGVLALESGERARIDPLVALAAGAEPEVRRGFVGAIAWCSPASLAATVRDWDRSSEAFERYLALCACSVHRADAGPGFAARIEDADPLVRARALRLAGELGKVELLDACLRHLVDPDAEAVFRAAWSGVLLGDRGPALAALERLALAEGPRRWIALEVAVRAMGIERGTRFIRAMNGDPALRRAMVVAVGHLGDPAAVPWLIRQMEDPELARVAGEAFSMITGVDLANDDLDGPPLKGLPGQQGRVAHDGLEPNPDPNLAWPDSSRVGSWWVSQVERFGTRRRHLMGHPIGVPLDSCDAQLFQPQQRAVAFETALAMPHAVLRSWVTRASASTIKQNTRHAA
jgi:uncharacterized protein (TIGR02270 family)